MGRPSKLTADREERIIQAKKVGASDRTAARVAGIDASTLRDWLRRGKDGDEGSRYRAFFEKFEEAAAHPRERALGIIYNALPDRPDLAWKFIERREDGYAPPIAAAAAASAPVNITLSFFETQRPAALETVAEVVDGQSGTYPSEPAQLAARATPEPAPGS